MTGFLFQTGFQTEPKIGALRECGPADTENLVRMHQCYRFHRFSRLTGLTTVNREGKDVIFATTLIALCRFYPGPGHVVASLDKTLYDDYLCLVASNKQQI